MEILTLSGLRALRSLLSGRILAMLLACIFVNFLVLVGLFLVFSWLLSATSFGVSSGSEMALDWGLRALAFGSSWFIFPLFLPIIISFFDDRIANSIEKRDYPDLPEVDPPFWPTFRQDLRFTFKAIMLNLLALPLYVFLPGLNLLIYYVLNGYLLGNEFFNMAVGRHMNRPDGTRLRRKHRGKVILGGIAIAFCATVPILNLISPLWGVCLMVHLLHQLRPDYKVQVMPAA